MSRKIDVELEFFQKAFESSPVGMTIFDSTGQCVVANEAITKIIGGSIEQVLKQNCFHIESWKESGLLGATLDAFNTGKSTNKEFCFTSTFGHKFNANVYITPFENEGENYLLFVFDDIGTIIENRQALYLSEKKYRQLAEHLDEVLWTVSPDWKELHYINPAYEKVWEKSCQSLYDNPRSWLDSVVKEDQPKLIETINSADFSKDATVIFPGYRIEKPDGEIRWIVATGYPLKNAEGEVVKVAGIAFDNTNQKRLELALQEVKDKLEKRVQERTAELEQKTISLEESNIALKVLMQQREKDKKELEKNILFNINKLVEPSLKKLMKITSDNNQKLYLEIIESNLNKIVSPFAPGLSGKLSKLTPAEIQIADFIRQGKTTKEVASLLALSPATIAAHRQNIRKKLALTNKEKNLRTVLTANS